MSNTIKIKGENKSIRPGKIVCIGRNYVAHIAELDNEMPPQPVIFCKPHAAIAHNIIFNQQEEIHYEAELCVLLKAGKVYAVACGLDLTKRQLQNQLKAKGLPWERAKAFDNSAVFSDFVPFQTGLETFVLKLFINDVLRQEAKYQQMMLKPQQIIDEIQRFMSLQDNDIVMTGTPKGVGKIHQGDEFRVELSVQNRRLLDKSWIVQ